MNKRFGITAAALLVILSGCATNPDGSTEYKRTGLGALIGAGVGRRRNRGYFRRQPWGQCSDRGRRRRLGRWGGGKLHGPPGSRAQKEPPTGEG